MKREEGTGVKTRLVCVYVAWLISVKTNLSLSLAGLRNKQTNTQRGRQRDRQTDGGTESEKPQRDFNYNCKSLGRIVDAVLRWQLFTLTRSQLRDTAHASSCAVQCDVDRRERSPDTERDTERALQTATGIVSRTRSWVLSLGLYAY